LLLNAVSGTNGATFNGLLQTSGTLSQNASGLTGTDAIITARRGDAFKFRWIQRSGPSYRFAEHRGRNFNAEGQSRSLFEQYHLRRRPGRADLERRPVYAGDHNLRAGRQRPTGAEGGTLTLAGVPTIQTTQIADGSGALLSVSGQRARFYWTRLNMLIQFDPYTGLTNNTMRWVAETRIALSVPRPASVSILSNLPVG